MSFYKRGSFFLIMIFGAFAPAQALAQSYEAIPGGGAFVVYNNTNATLTAVVLQDRNEVKNTAEIAPGEKRVLKGFLPPGRVTVEMRALKVQPEVKAISEVYWVSHSTAKVREWEIFPKFFGKTFLADSPGKKNKSVAAKIKESWEGEWGTSYGSVMIFKQDPDSSIVGRYNSDGGRIVGAVEGHTLDGFWVENGSKEKCGSKKDGSDRWGKFVITFNDNFTSYKGHWTYCGKGKNEGEWKGDKKTP